MPLNAVRHPKTPTPEPQISITSENSTSLLRQPTTLLTTASSQSPEAPLRHNSRPIIRRNPEETTTRRPANIPTRRPRIQRLQILPLGSLLRLQIIRNIRRRQPRRTMRSLHRRIRICRNRLRLTWPQILPPNPHLLKTLCLLLPI